MTERRALISLFIVSLALRALVCAWTVAYDVEPLYDEGGYMQRALAWSEVYSSLISGSAPSTETWSAAYGDGHWPPLHPMTLALVLSLWPTVAAARGVAVVLGALTTVVVYLLAKRMVPGMSAVSSGGGRAALLAAAAHALSPSFILFGHSLWSETLAILLLLSGVLLAVDASEADAGTRAIWRAAASGVLLGLAVMTRVATLPLALATLLWLSLASGRPTGRSLRAASLCALTLTATLLPWQLVLRHHEGQPTPWLSTLGGFNIALGNHPEVPPGYGSSWGHETSKATLVAELRSDADAAGRQWHQMAAPLAKREIAARPAAAMARAMTRGWLLWAPDVFASRHVVMAVYPPLPKALAALVLFAVAAGSLVLLSAMVAGLVGGQFRRPSHRWLLVLLVLAGMAGPVMSVATTRLHLPLLAVALPAIGLALHGELVRRRAALVAALAACLLSAGALPRVMALYWIPSSYYAPLLDRLPDAVASDFIYSDSIELRRLDAAGEDVLINIAGPGSIFADGSASLRFPGPRREQRLEIWTTGLEDPVLEVRSLGGARLGRVVVVSRAVWREPQIVTLPDGSTISLRWLGGGPSPR